MKRNMLSLRENAIDGVVEKMWCQERGSLGADFGCCGHLAMLNCIPANAFNGDSQIQSPNTVPLGQMPLWMLLFPKSSIDERIEDVSD